MTDDERKRDARAKTAQDLVRATANGPKPLTYREAQERVNRACERGDRIRRESGG